MKSILLAMLFLSACMQVLAVDEQPSVANPVKIQISNGVQDESLKYLMRFENIFMNQIDFEGEALRGKQYQLFAKEFVAGKLIRTETLFDGTEAEFFRIQDEKLSFRMLCKTQGGKLRTQMATPKFSSKRLEFALQPSEMDYVLKDFFGSKSTMTVSADKPFYLYTIIPPTMHADGNGSYCEVAQSDVPAEDLGRKFGLPQYFLIEMRFVPKRIDWQ